MAQMRQCLIGDPFAKSSGADRWAAQLPQVNATHLTQRPRAGWPAMWDLFRGQKTAKTAEWRENKPIRAMCNFAQRAKRLMNRRLCSQPSFVPRYWRKWRVSCNDNGTAHNNAVPSDIPIMLGLSIELPE
jgi:hypothetical protein